MSRDAKGCEGCRYLMRMDTGYSNYTVTGTSVACLKGVNPGMPLCDEDVESATFDAVMGFGETCATKSPGYGPWFDVDGDVTDEDFKDDPEIYALLKERTEGDSQ